MPCTDGRITSDLELYADAQKRLNALTALFCATMKDVEQQGLLHKMRGDTQDWWAKHQVDDARRKSEERASYLRARFMMLSLKEQEDLIAGRGL